MAERRDTTALEWSLLVYGPHLHGTRRSSFAFHIHQIAERTVAETRNRTITSERVSGGGVKLIAITD